MQFPAKKLTYFFYFYFALMIVWSIILYITHQTTSDWNYLFNIGIASFYLSGGAIAFIWSKKSEIRNSILRELITVGAGVTIFGVGLLIWSYYNLILRDAVPYPSIADAVFIFYFPILAYGIISLLRVFGIMISKRIYLETLIIFILTAIFIFTIGNPPDLSSSLPILTKTLNISYLLGDSLLISLGIMLIRLTRGKIHNSFFYFFIGFFSMASADFLFSYRTAHETYWNGDITDIFFTLAGLMFTLGIIKIIATQSAINKFVPPEQKVSEEIKNA